MTPTRQQRNITPGFEQIRTLLKSHSEVVGLMIFVVGCAVFFVNLFVDTIPVGARIMGMTLALGLWLLGFILPMMSWSFAS